MINSRNIEAILDALPAPCLVLMPNVPDFTIVRANKAFCRASGLRNGDLASKGIFEVFLKDQEAIRRSGYEKCLERAIEFKTSQKTDVQEYHKPIQGTNSFEIRYWNAEISPVLDEAGEVEFLLHISTDISDQVARNLTETTRSELEVQLLINNTEECFLLVDKELKIISFNQQFFRLYKDFFGSVVKKGDLILDYAPPGRREITRSIYENVLQGAEESSEIVIEVSTGSEKVYCLKYKPALDEHSKVIGAFVTMNDITETAAAKAKLEASEEKYRLLFYKSPLPQWIFDLGSYRILDVNEAAIEHYGYCRNEFLTMTIQNISPQSLIPKMLKYLEELRINKEVYRFGLSAHRKKNGDLIQVEVAGHYLSYHDRDCMIAVCNDVTRRELALKGLKHNEAKFRAFFENSMDGILLTELSGRVLSANPSACALFGMSEAEICNAGRAGLVDPADPKLELLLQERLNNGKAKGEIIHVRKDGTKFPAEVSSAIFIDAYGEERTSMIIRDITASKEAQAKIQEGIQRFNYVAKATSDAIWDWDLTTETSYTGEGFQTIFGYLPQEDKAAGNSWKDRIHADDVDRILSEVHQVFNGTEVNWAGEYRYLKADGTYAFVADKGFVIRDEHGRATRMVGAMQDITKRKNDEFALQQSESRLKGIIASQSNYILRIDLEGNYSYYNQKFMDDFGWIHHEANLIGLNSKVSIMEYHYPRVVDTVEKCFANLNEVFQVEIDKPARNGGVKTTFWDFTCLTDSAGQPTEIQCIGIDISDKKKAERDLIDTLEEKNTILESIGDAFFAVDRDWIVTYWNQKAENMLNTPRSKIIGKYLWDVFSDSIDSVSYKKYNEAVDTKQTILFEDFYPTLSRWYEVSVYPSESGLSIYFRDVTERKQHIAALKLSEQRFKALVQEGSDLISIIDEDSQYKYLSPAYKTILGIEAEELIGARPLNRIHEEDRGTVAQASEMLRTQKRVQFLPYRYKAGDDQYRWLESIATNLVDDPAIEGILFNSKDVTDRINYIQAMEEQNIKLREIAWIQSHLVRSPVSRILGLVNIIRTYQDKENETELLNHIYNSALELDVLIRDIVDKTQKIDF